MQENKKILKEFLDYYNDDYDRAIDDIRNFRKKSGVLEGGGTIRNEQVLLSFQSVSKIYKVKNKTVRALDNVNLSIYKGEIVALVGPSGSGKSTLLQLMGCMDKPTSGSIRFLEKNTVKLRDDQSSDLRAKYIGFIFQSFYLQPFLNVKQNILLPINLNSNIKISENELNQIIKSVNLENESERMPRELSGGQIQRVAIARALIARPQLVLADEPTGNLDNGNAEKIINMFFELRDKFDLTFVIATHDQRIATCADRIIHIDMGIVN